MNKEQLRMQLLAGLITESEYKSKLSEENNYNDYNPNYDYHGGGQGSGSESMTLKGNPIDKSSLKIGMQVKIQYRNNSGLKVIDGIVKNMDMDYVYMQIPEQELDNYIKSYAIKYAKYGKPILMQDITAITIA